MTKRDEVIGKSGIFAKSSSVLAQGIMFLILGLICLFIVGFVLNEFVNADHIGYANYIVIRSDISLAIFLLGVFTVLVFLIGGIGNIYTAMKSKNARYTLGERKSVWFIKGTEGITNDMIAFIEAQNYCPNCNSNLGPMQINFCPECGHDLTAEPVKKEWSP